MPADGPAFPVEPGRGPPDPCGLRPPLQTTHRQREIEIGGNGAAQKNRALKDHGLRLARRPVEGATLPLHVAGGWRQQTVQKAKQQALAGAVGPHDDRAPTGPDRETDIVHQTLPVHGPAQIPRREKRRDGIVVVNAAVGGEPMHRGLRHMRTSLPMHAGP